MRNLGRALVCGLGVSMVWLAVSAASAQSVLPPQFSADLLLTRPSRPPVQGRVYSGGEKWRFDVASNGRVGAMIFDLRAGTVEVLVPQNKVYMEVHRNEAAMGPLSLPDIRPVDPSNPCALASWTNCRKLGSEVVNGRPCDDWQFSTGAVTKVGCLDRRIHVFIRTTSSDGGRAELRHISERVQPKALFEIPPGYRRMEPSPGQSPR